jgi:hypothetical protein
MSVAQFTLEKSLFLLWRAEEGKERERVKELEPKWQQPKYIKPCFT